MGLEFLNRTFRTFSIVLLALLPFGFFYLNVYQTLALLSGAVWGMLNLVFLTTLVRASIRPEGVEVGSTVALLVIKFPMLYLAGYGLLKVNLFEPPYLLLGASGIMVIIVLKVIGRYLLGLDTTERSAKTASGAA